MAEWFYTRVFNTDGTTMLDDPFELTTGLQPMTPGGDLVELSNGDNVYIQYGILGLAFEAGADAIHSTGGSHFLRIDGGIGSLTGNVIDISGTQNENQIFITAGAGMDVFNGTGDAIRLTGATVADTFNDITNDGYITSSGGRAIFTTVGDLSLVNTGSVIGNADAVSMVFGSVINRATGIIGGGDGVGIRFASLAGQDSAVVNDGLLGGGDGAIVGGAGLETVINNGQILGDILLGDGIDTYDASGGGRVVGGIIDLGAGDDVGIGSGAREVFTAGLGNDSIESGAGDDTFRAGVAAGTDGNDLFDGEGGRDTYSAVASATGVTINLAEGYARGTRIGNDTLIDIERAIGSNGIDTIVGDELANAIQGLDGNDTLSGDAGIDRIDGGIGSDGITGGLGRDILTGGAGFDDFIYNEVGDSGPTNATRDRITDFLAGQDDINLSSFAGTFTFQGGAAFTGAGPEVRFQAEGTNTLVQISTDADTDVEMSIILVGNIALTIGDFDL